MSYCRRPLPRYRITLSTGEVWVTAAANAAAARTEAFIHCPAMRLFTVHIVSTERIKEESPR